MSNMSAFSHRGERLFPRTAACGETWGNDVWRLSGMLNFPSHGPQSLMAWDSALWGETYPRTCEHKLWTSCSAASHPRVVRRCCIHRHLKQQTHSGQALKRVAPELSTALSTQTGDNVEASQGLRFVKEPLFNAGWFIPYRTHKSPCVQAVSLLVR